MFYVNLDMPPDAPIEETEIDVSESGATIVWSTDKPTDSVVRFGDLTPPSSARDDWRMVTEHGIPLTDLSACTVYYYSVGGTDGAGNVVEDDDGGTYHHFETLTDILVQAPFSPRHTPRPPTT